MKQRKKWLTQFLATVLVAVSVLQPVNLSVVQASQSDFVTSPLTADHVKEVFLETVDQLDGEIEEEQTGFKLQVQDEEFEAEESGASGDATESGEEKNLIRKATSSEAIVYNTGNQNIKVVTQEAFEDAGVGDACFEEDGSYTIQIPEENPFFPYEVQFTSGGKTERRWFMDPEDSVRVNGHRFYVDAYFDGEVVTQMSLNVAGETVIVYPEKKEFTDDGGAMPLSLLPLESRYLQVDLTGFTPLELTMVSLDALFTGEETLEDTDHVSWARYDDGYKISSSDGHVNLSAASDSGWASYTMIVGEADQLAASNVKYRVSVDATKADEWLTPTVYDRESTALRVKLNRISISDDTSSMNVTTQPENAEQRPGYLGIQMNQELFVNSAVDTVKVVKGNYTTPEAAERGEDITAKILHHTDDSSPVVGDESWYELASPNQVTFLAYDGAGNIIGCLPMRLYVYNDSNSITAKLLTENGDRATRYSGFSYSSGRYTSPYTMELAEGFSADDIYYLSMSYQNSTTEDAEAGEILGAYIGAYTSLDAAKAAGAENVQEKLFSAQGYPMNLKEAVTISVFVMEGGKEVLYSHAFQVQEYARIESTATHVYFTGLLDGQGNQVEAHIMSASNDDYAEDSYVTILVDGDVDCSALAPTFSKDESTTLYVSGGTTAVESGKNPQDFSDGPVQYIASSEDGKYSKNYWVTVISSGVGAGQLYINSLENPESNTKVEDGVIYSIREMFLNEYSDNYHDILLINTGAAPIPNLDVELVSDQVELDAYWTLTGNHELSGYEAGSVDLSNQAKLRLVPKEGAADGRAITGTLTIKSGNQALMVLELTGIAGNPSITMTEIPNAVKYVHYGTMIEHNNLYSFNTVSFRLTGGRLPDGMTLRENGELYGVPTESGEFNIFLRMENSAFDSVSSVSFTLTVLDNTDVNVDGATDISYELKERIPDIALNDNSQYTMTSSGEFGEWENLYLDGVQLEKGVDYEAESGSTRLTIRSQTLKQGNTLGTHTLSAEFRTENKIMKRAAQNYKVVQRSNNGGNSSRAVPTANGLMRDSKKGYISAENGIITGEGNDYSKWSKEETGWRLIYADGSAAAGSQVTLEDGSTVEQILWEKVNGSYYAFGSNGYLLVGWVFDYQLNNWYYVSEQTGMRSGWYDEEQDGCTYYLNPVDGALLHGWQKIDEKWYYLNEISQQPTWVYNADTNEWFYNVSSKTRPWGALFENTRTPDGYWVDENGAWDENVRWE